MVFSKSLTEKVTLLNRCLRVGRNFNEICIIGILFFKIEVEEGVSLTEAYHPDLPHTFSSQEVT